MKQWFLHPFFWWKQYYKSVCPGLEFLFFALQRCGVVVITTAQLHSTNTELRFCADSKSARGGALKIRDGDDLWQWSRLEIRLNIFRRSTMPQKQFNSSTKFIFRFSYQKHYLLLLQNSIIGNQWFLGLWDFCVLLYLPAVWIWKLIHFVDWSFWFACIGLMICMIPWLRSI